MPLQAILLLIFCLPSVVEADGISPHSVPPPRAGGLGGVFWIANEGQWQGDFQFKCEVGNTTYYVTPQGMTIDIHQVVGADGNPPASALPPFTSAEMGGLRGASVSPSVILNKVKDPSEKKQYLRGHVIQIHYSDPPPRAGGQGGVSSRGEQLCPPSAGVPAPLESAKPHGENLLPHYSHYFLGRDSTHWRSRVPHYQTVIAEEVWPGIDIEYRADKQGVETIYHVAPGADPTQIQMEYLGLDAPLRTDSQGNLILATSLGEVKEQAPYAYQMDGRVQKRVESTYRIIGGNRVAFEFDRHDLSKELVVDPLLYSTYLGGGGTDYGGPITPAPDGGVYVAGTTYGLSGFPTTPGAFDETGLFPGSREFVSHFGPTGEFLASTLFGEIQTSQNPNTEGGAQDLVYDTARESVWICGNAHPSWPLTPDAQDTTIELGESFILQLSGDLSDLEYCSYLGGSQFDYSNRIDILGNGRICVVGESNSSDFPLTDDALFTEIEGGGMSTLWIWDPSSREPVFSTFFGGSGVDHVWSLHIGPNERIWLGGDSYSLDLPVTVNAFQPVFSDSFSVARDAYIAMITLNPPAIGYCSYLGGNDHDYITAIQEVDSAIYIAGRTRSSDFPVTPGAFDTSGHADNNEGFVSRLEWESGSYIGTFLGGEESEFVFSGGNWVNTSGILVGGYTNSGNFPVTPDAFDLILNDNGQPLGDAFVLKLSLDLTQVLYGSYIGGTHNDESIRAYVENGDSLWLVGTTSSLDFPTTPDAFQPGDNAFNSVFLTHFAIDTTADTTSTSNTSPLPTEFALSVFPNPFNPTTTISFSLPRATTTELTIHNILGQQIEHIDFGKLQAGHHTQQIGNPNWTSGLYFATLKTTQSTKTTKLLLLR